MKNICIIVPTSLPIPAIQGGAVETLIEMLIDENEINPNFNITLFAAFNRKNIEKQETYKFTTFLTFNVNHMILFPYKVFQYIMERLLSKNIPFVYSFRHVVEYLRKNNSNFDYIIVSGGDIKSTLVLKEFCEKEKLILHFHGATSTPNQIEEVFQNIVCVSKYSSDLWKKNSRISPLNIRVLKNCIKSNSFKQRISIEERLRLRSRLAISKDEFVIIFTGRIVKEKGIIELIESVNRMDGEATLLIVGSSKFGVHSNTTYEKKVRKLARDSKKKVIFLGYVHNSQVYLYHQISDVAVVPSIWNEPAGLVTIEALTSGLPVLATKSGGIPEYSNHNSTILVDNDSSLIENLSKNLIFLRDNPGKRLLMSKAGEIFARKFDQKNYFINFVELIDEISINN